MLPNTTPNPINALRIAAKSLGRIRSSTSNKNKHVSQLVKYLIPKTTTKISKKVHIRANNQFWIQMNSNPRSTNRYKGLSTFLESANKTKPLTLGQKKAFYDDIASAFRGIEHSDSKKAWIQRADLLDAIDTLVKMDGKHFKPLTVKPKTAETSPLKKGATPLVSYNKIKSATAEFRGQTFQSAQEAKDKGLPVEQEYANTAKWVERGTRTKGGKGVPQFMNVTSRHLTRALGFVYTKKSSPSASRRTKKIAKFSRGMGITSSEVVQQKKIGPDRKTVTEYIYHGPKHIFGKSIHEYKTIDEFFGRDWTPKARSEQLAKAARKERTTAMRYGNPDGTSQIGVVNSNSRVLTVEHTPGDIWEPQILAQKVLSDKAVQEAKKKGDNPAYYEDKYEFSLKEALGRKQDDDMQPKKISHDRVKELKLKVQNTHSEKGRKAVLKNKNTQGVIRGAQHELLAGMGRAFNQMGAIQVNQRLAPADIHNYVAPVDGKPLSHKEASEFLKARLEKQEKLALESGNKEEVIKIKKEIAHLNQLIGIFNEQEILLGRPSQSTIDIHGTAKSVARPAVLNRPGILSQNSRKIMFLDHGNGNFSMHIFIGATGVGRVNVNPETDAMKRGAQQGDMRFGGESKTTGDQTKKLQLGEWQGGFPINGSTILSFYLPTDMTLLPKVEGFKEVKLHHEAKHGRVEQEAPIEFLAQMGDPLVIRTPVRLAQIMEEKLGRTFFDPNKSPDDLIKELEKAGLSDLPEVDQKKLNWFIKNRDQRIPEFIKLNKEVRGAIRSRKAIRGAIQAQIDQTDVPGMSPEVYQENMLGALKSWVKESPPTKLPPHFKHYQDLMKKDVKSLSLAEQMDLAKLEREFVSILNETINQ